MITVADASFWECQIISGHRRTFAAATARGAFTGVIAARFGCGCGCRCGCGRGRTGFDTWWRAQGGWRRGAWCRTGSRQRGGCWSWPGDGCRFRRGGGHRSRGGYWNRGGRGIATDQRPFRDRCRCGGSRIRPHSWQRSRGRHRWFDSGSGCWSRCRQGRLDFNA